METAEYLYLVLSTKDTGIETEEVEEILLETQWFVLSGFASSFQWTDWHLQVI